jgi:small subunit ribosomal protein S8
MYIDLIIKIKNAGAARKDSLKTPYSKINQGILEVLKQRDFIKSYEVKGKSVKKFIEVELAEGSAIRGLKLLSKPSRRLYAGYKEMKKPKGGHGLLVVSTSGGIMGSDEARKKKMGGQLLFEVW